MKFAQLAVAALALAATPALAAPGDVAVGATVYGPQGNAVGQIVTVEGGQAILDTGKHKVPLALSMYGKSDKGPTITVTKDQLDTMVEQQIAAANAKRDAALIPGAAVVAAKGSPAGTIKSVEGDDVVLESPEGPVAMKREHFAINSGGALMALFTADQIKASAAGGTPSSTAEAGAKAQ
jgi:hypothetical protein